MFAAAGGLAAVSCHVGFRPPTNPVATAIQWQRWEAGLTAQKEHPDPYAGLELDVHFSGSNGTAFTVPGFWDGDRGFRFRAAFPAPGVWRWRTTCSESTDAGLHGRTGEVRVSGYTGENPGFGMAICGSARNGGIWSMQMARPFSGWAPRLDAAGIVPASGAL